MYYDYPDKTTRKNLSKDTSIFHEPFLIRKKNILYS